MSERLTIRFNRLRIGELSIGLDFRRDRNVPVYDDMEATIIRNVGCAPFEMNWVFRVLLLDHCEVPSLSCLQECYFPGLSRGVKWT